MLGSSVLGGNSGSPTNNRVFVYEVTGLKQNETNDKNNYQFRSSSSVFVSVPYSRMNEEMQRIGKMGGTIVNIQSLEAFKQQEQNNSPENNKAANHKKQKADRDDQN
ncbi:phycobilisome linker polypeptide [Waterburya agarophytonicola K14]|uniref:Phycobilisome linker polypeptide n=1 Tax=Waterburya agarophytonicola KI4 TaxID=2874699 RepID=A0A964FFL1_9CYAN|nr:phycobilisome linker polypeptide [Waterburya agarophytonicola]MCC0177117.1 phycobilisome linker polypeptide [Waterburya agarophytonicola KI4]